MLKTDCPVAMLMAALSAAPSQVGLLFAFEETAEGVFRGLSGSLDVSNALPDFPEVATIDAQIVPGFAIIRSIPVGIFSVNIDGYVIDGPSSFGFGGTTRPSSHSGDVFHVASDLLGLPDGYVSAKELSGTLGFAGATFESLGLTPEPMSGRWWNRRPTVCKARGRSRSQARRLRATRSP